ncbi:MAG: hypothetical protein ABID54_03100, partial [Pseudomonadota bacterium]
VTGYLWGLKQLYHDKTVRGIKADVIYKRGKAPIVHMVSDPIYRTERDLLEWELGTIGTINEITQKVQEYEKNNALLSMLFWRHHEVCAKWKCEYEDICRLRPQKGEAPIGFYCDKGEN